MNKKMAIYGMIVMGIIATVIFIPRGVNPIIKSQGLEGKSIQEMVAILEDRVINPDELIVSITGKELTFTTPSSNHRISLKNEQFYLSVAPYVNQTHPCANHNLTTCRGELANRAFDVTVRDTNNLVIFQDTVMSYSNGFFGIWLPRNLEGTITVSHNGLSSSTEITTYSSSDTCLTTLKLT